MEAGGGVAAGLDEEEEVAVTGVVGGAAEEGEVAAGAGDPAAAAASLAEELREKHRQRCLKFGLPFDPAEAVPRAEVNGYFSRQEVLAERREKARAKGRDTGIAAGVDLFSPEEQARIAARAAKFGALVEDPSAAGAEPLAPEEAMQGMDVDLLEPRAEAPPDAARREDALYMYGVDVLNTKECLGYFVEYGPALVEWVNDSSCVVVFEDSVGARRALLGTGRPLAAGATPEGCEAAMGDQLDEASRWFKGPDAQKNGNAVPIVYRYATDADVKPAQNKSRYLWLPNGRGRGGRLSRGPPPGLGPRPAQAGFGSAMDAEEAAIRSRRGGRKRKGGRDEEDVLERVRRQKREQEQAAAPKPQGPSKAERQEKAAAAFMADVDMNSDEAQARMQARLAKFGA